MKLYILCLHNGVPAYNVGCLTFTYTEKRGAEQKIAEYEKRYKSQLKRHKGRDIPSWVKNPDYIIKEVEL